MKKGKKLNATMLFVADSQKLKEDWKKSEMPQIATIKESHVGGEISTFILLANCTLKNC